MEPAAAAAADVPPVIASQTTYCNPKRQQGILAHASGYDEDPPTPAAVTIDDVYQGLERRVRRGEARYLQVMEQVEKNRQRTGAPRGWCSGINPIIGRGTVHVKRVIGRVPLDADGSAWFTVPPLKSVSFDVLDAQGKLLARMGSDMHLMPGEHRGCIGCHENRDVPATATRYTHRAPLAMRHGPSTPEQPAWGTAGIIDFPRVVQPVLDKYCVKCHSGPTAARRGRSDAATRPASSAWPTTT